MERILEIILSIITIAFIGIFVQGFTSLLIMLVGKPSNKKEVRVRHLILVLSAVASLVFVGLLILMIQQNISEDIYNKISSVIMMSPLISMGMILVMICANYQIKYDDTGFTYRNLFRIKRRYSYSDVSGIIENDLSYKLVINDKKRLMIYDLSVGASSFIETIEQ